MPWAWSSPSRAAAGDAVAVNWRAPISMTAYHSPRFRASKSAETTIWVRWRRDRGFRGRRNMGQLPYGSGYLPPVPAPGSLPVGLSAWRHRGHRTGQRPGGECRQMRRVRHLHAGCPWAMTSLTGPVNARGQRRPSAPSATAIRSVLHACPTGALKYVPWSDKTKEVPPRIVVPASIQSAVADSCAKCH